MVLALNTKHRQFYGHEGISTMPSQLLFLQSFPSPIQKWVQFYFSDTLPRLEEAEVISCDVFDTLLFRQCSVPHDLFQEVGLRLKQDGHLLIDMSPQEFVSVRRRAEEHARADSKNSECTLSDIAQEMKLVVNQEVLQAYELIAESDYCFLNEPLTSVLEHLKTMGKKIILTSDTYFTTKEIATLLRNAGFPLHILDKLFASCDLGVNKAFGGLYKHIGRLYPPRKIIHLGDNYAVDVAKAQEYGIIAQYIPQRGFLSPFLEREKAMRLGDADLASSESLRELVGRQAIAEPEALQFFFTAGATIFGPALARYAEWCITDCVKNNISDILAFTREAETLVPLLKNAAAQQEAEINIIPFYASRQALCMPSFDKVDLLSLVELIHKRNSISYERHFSNLGLTDEKFYALLNVTDKSKAATTKESVDLVYNILQSEEICRQIARNIHQKRNQFLQYFSTIKLSSHNIAIADLGFAGTTQKYLSRILQTFLPNPIRGYYLCLNEGASQHALDGRIALGYLGNYGRDKASTFALSQHPEALEQSLISHHGTTLGYADGGPHLEPTIPHYYQVQETEAVRRGIFAFQAAYIKNTSALSSPEFRARIQANIDEQNKNILYRFFAFPLKSEAIAFGRWVHDDNFGTNHTRFLCKPQQASAGELPCWPQGMRCLQNEDQMEQLFQLLTSLRDT